MNQVYAEELAYAGAAARVRQSSEPAVLTLADGTEFSGYAYGKRGKTLGEVVFSTGMTGYQETLTDPSYAGQIVVQTAPHIGNTGVNAQDMESRQVWVSGYVLRDPARRPSNWRSEESLEELLVRENIVSMTGIDTRQLTRILRSEGAMNGGIFSGEALTETTAAQRLDLVRNQPAMAGLSFVDEVTLREAEVVPAEGERIGRVAVVDLGLKAATPRNMAARGLEVHVLPAEVSLADIQARNVDAVFFSNGPGDPATADKQVELLREVLRAGIPYFGICFGHQLLGRALGFGTYKLRFGHRGINQPVLERASGHVDITAHNHGFAVDVPLEGTPTAPFNNGEFGRVQVSHIGLNDEVVEGIECLDIPAFSVQYHPEAAAGPHDALSLFDRFVEMVRTGRVPAPASQLAAVVKESK